jgi:hypothetical protein
MIHLFFLFSEPDPYEPFGIYPEVFSTPVSVCFAPEDGG